MKIVELDGYAANPGDLSYSAFEELGEFVVYPRTAPDEVVERAKDADIILVNKVIIDENVINSLPKLKYIGVMATGYNVVDIEAAASHGSLSSWYSRDKHTGLQHGKRGADDFCAHT